MMARRTLPAAAPLVATPPANPYLDASTRSPPRSPSAVSSRFPRYSENELRLFISSTFRDLQEEREHLVRKIFPEIRALCRERGITFTEVDLRWGLTDEDVVLGQVVRTCLEEIDKCRPYFIGITGERYGYVPDLVDIYKDAELLTRYPWIEDAAMQGSSIIDLEFRHAALNDAAAARASSRFFFRRTRRGSESAVDVDEAGRLEELRQRVRDEGFVVEEFRDPGSLGEAVYDALVEIIERDFADAAPPSDLERERASHEAFAASRRHAYIPNPSYLSALNAWHADAEAPPLIIYAESGSGKSSLVSFWCQQQRRRVRDAFIVEHYVGIGAGSVDHYAIMRHVMEEIRTRFDRSEEIPSKPEELEAQFGNWLGFTLGAPMLLVIDGINQLSGPALDLHWLPPMMPPGVKLVITSTVEQTLIDLRRRDWRESVGGERALDVLWGISMLLSTLGCVSEALGSAREQLELAVEVGDRQVQARAHSWISWHLNVLGDTAGAEEHARRAESIARDLGDRLGVATAVARHGDVHVVRYEYEQALVCFVEWEAIAREIGNRRGVAAAVGNRGLVHSERSELEQAFACLVES